jgi:hypothetical protein
MSPYFSQSNSRKPVWLSATTLFAATLVSAVGGAEDHLVVPLSSDTFHHEIKERGDDWLVVFCNESSVSCQHMVDSFKLLSTIWTSTGLVPIETRFGEVGCNHDKGLCDREGLVAVPAAVHYRDGMRVASWKAENEDTISVWQFAAWAKTELSLLTTTHLVDDADTGVEKHSAHHFQIRSPFAGMHEEEEVLAWCLVLIAMAVVGYVIVEGFELWPAKMGKDLGTSTPTIR